MLQLGGARQVAVGNGASAASDDRRQAKTVSDLPPAGQIQVPASYQKFTSQDDLGKYLTGEVPHPHGERALELRGVPPMSDYPRNKY